MSHPAHIAIESNGWIRKTLCNRLSSSFIFSFPIFILHNLVGKYEDYAG